MSELMKCVFCGAEWQSDRDGSTDWRVMDVAGRRFFFCPKETPPPGAPAEQFAAAKKRAQDKVREIIENEPPPACQVCGCTELSPCVIDGKPCHWISPGVLCSACLKKVPLPRTQMEIMAVIQPLLQIGIAMPIAGIDGFYILSSLQLVLLHPNFPPHLREAVLEFARDLQLRISLTPALAAMCEAGWDRGQDVGSESRIILPGEF